MNNLKITYNSSSRRRKEEEKEKCIELYSSSPSYQTISTMTSLKKITIHGISQQCRARTAWEKQQLLCSYRQSSCHQIADMKSILRRLHDVNNWLPSVTMAVPSPMNVVMDISVSRIRSSSVATSLILGRRLDDGFRHWKARPTSSFMPSEVKLPPNLGSISSFELKCASIFPCDKENVCQWAVSKRNLLNHKKLQLILNVVIFSLKGAKLQLMLYIVIFH
jgi:hypothetical protein